jgi:hypothetical protein
MLMIVSVLRQVPFAPGDNRFQKYDTGLHCKVRTNQNTRPTTMVTPMTVHRRIVCVFVTVRRRRATAIEILATTHVTT